jgi:ABC-type Na+ efflux pump permease subunit
MFVVARRELLERVRSKWFAVMTLIGPIGMIAMVVVPALIASSSTAGTESRDRRPVRRARCARAREQFTKQQWDVKLVDPATPDQIELDRIRDNQIGFIDRRGRARRKRSSTAGDNARAASREDDLADGVTDTFKQAQAKRANVSEAQLKAIDIDPTFLVTAARRASGTGAFLIAYILRSSSTWSSRCTASR